jgi:hypothetical protein
VMNHQRPGRRPSGDTPEAGRTPCSTPRPGRMHLDGTRPPGACDLSRNASQRRFVAPSRAWVCLARWAAGARVSGHRTSRTARSAARRYETPGHRLCAAGGELLQVRCIGPPASPAR